MQLTTDKTIELTEEQSNKIKEALPELFKKLKYKIGEEYWFLNALGIGINTYRNDEDDKQIIERGLDYKTEAEAKHADELSLAITRVKDYISEHFGEFEPDWNDEKQVKYSICYDYMEDKLGWYIYSYHKYSSDIDYLKSEEDCKQLIKDCKEDLEFIIKSK